MGNIRSKHIKKISKEILEQHPKEVTDKFSLNKILVDNYTHSSKKLRNRIAGYLVVLHKARDNEYEAVRKDYSNPGKRSRRKRRE